MMDCLINIVGVSNSDCECITEGLTDEQKAAIKVSTSQLYLDDLPGGVHLKSLEYVEACKKMAEMALNELTNATAALEDDLIVALNNKYKKAKPNFLGQIGRMSFSANLGGINGNYQGLRLRASDYGDGVINLTGITLIVNLDATFKIYLYKNFAGEEIGEKVAEWEITTEANMYKKQTMDLRLPLMIDGRAMEYIVFYDRTEAGGAVPKNNDIECSTCNRTTTNRIENFVSAKGVQFDDLNDLKNVTADSYSHGFTLDVSIKCDNQQLFCREYTNEDAIAVTMARAVWYKGGELLIEAVLKSPEVNRYTTMNRDYLWGKRNHFKKEYEGRVEYLAEAVDVSASNCYVCRQAANQPFHSGIFS